MAVVKYVRVSTKTQNPARQETDADKYDKVYVDYASGKDTDRPQFKAMMDWVREGDTVVVDSYSRLARDAKDLLSIVQQLNDMGVDVISQKEQIDTTTPQGKFALSVIAGIAQFERETIRQRTLEGIEIAKAEGRYGGRKRLAIDDNKLEHELKKWREGKQTGRATAKNLGISTATLYRRAKELGL